MGVSFRKSPRPSLPLKRAPPLTPTLSPSGEREETALLGAQNRFALRLTDHQRSRHIVRDGTAWRQNIYSNNAFRIHRNRFLLPTNR